MNYFLDPPSPRKKAMRTLTPGELEVLLESCQDSPYYSVIYTAVSTGLRQAELLGLRWRDIDLDMLSLSVSQVLYKRRRICQYKIAARESIADTGRVLKYLYEMH